MTSVFITKKYFWVYRARQTKFLVLVIKNFVVLCLKKYYKLKNNKAHIQKPVLLKVCTNTKTNEQLKKITSNLNYLFFKLELTFFVFRIISITSCSYRKLKKGLNSDFCIQKIMKGHVTKQLKKQLN